MFVDICGSTQLYETLGDAAASATVMRCLDLLRQRCEQAGGRVIQRIGDELMCAFENADAALATASVMQESVTRDQEPGQPTLAIRVGCHFGPVIEDRGELFGDSVNIAARAAAFAREGQVITTADTVNALTSLLRGRVRTLGPFPVKGKRDGLMIYEFVWQEGEETITLMGTHPGLVRSSRLVLKYAGKEVTFDSNERRTLTLGRESGCDVVIADSRASRKHARIETRLHRFVLIDQSVNGTYVQISDEDELILRHEELILYSSGRIGFGIRSAGEQSAIVEFTCR
jgi:hypothetical protein